MKKNLIMSVLVASMMSLSAPASALDLMGMFLKKALEDPVQDVVENAVKDAILDSITGGASNGKKGHKSNDNAKAKLPDPVPGRVADGDYRWLPLTGDFRFPVPEDVVLKNLQAGARGGYVDRFGSEWVPYRVNGRIVAWRSYLSERGHFRLAAVAGKHSSLLIGRDGKNIGLPGA
jgi:hypothetical protein